MIGRKMWYLATLLLCALLPLAGCSGGGSSVKATEQGTQITVGGKVDTGKAAAKAAFMSATSADSALTKKNSVPLSCRSPGRNAASGS